VAPAPARRPARKRANHYHHGDLRRAMLQAAVRTIRTHGIDGLTLRGVGSALGVSRTALYRHFADKAALLAAVAAEGFRMLRLDLEAVWNEGGRGRAGFEAMGVAYVRFAVAHPSHYRVMFGADIPKDGADIHEDGGDIREDEDANPELAQEGAGSFQVLVDAITALQEQDLARRDDPHQMAMFVWAAVHGVAMLAIDGRLGHQALAIESLTEYTTDRIRAAIAAAG
jgi:AcrR family transcriptional regulator